MPFSTILVAVDGGEFSQRITTYALHLAGNAAVHFVCAVDPNRFFSDAAAPVFDAVNDRRLALEAAGAVVDRCVARATQAAINATGHIVQETPVDAILKTATLIDADVIVMASHGRHGLARAVIGSVAEAVARRASIAVLFVPTTAPDEEPNRRVNEISRDPSVAAQA